MCSRDLSECVLTFFTPQELSKITMPIVFNEPLSFLQRITEYMEHTYLINRACSLPDSIERMQVHTHRHNHSQIILLDLHLCENV